MRDWGSGRGLNLPAGQSDREQRPAPAAIYYVRTAHPERSDIDPTQA
ncbi:hypothetical protein ACWD7F_36230 [Streptomyces sp. NPDC005122]